MGRLIRGLVLSGLLFCLDSVVVAVVGGVILLWDQVIRLLLAALR